ncbi:MAG: exonuclease domain-containing protein [Cytophagales bacterium]
MFAIIDIETTGGSYRYEKIIEIAIVIYDGDKILDTFQSLINPEMLIPMHITRLTGISNDMVKNAPKFFEIAKEIVQITEDKIFVAHNVNFDFGFIKKAFSDLGFNYTRKKLCTVKYARQVYPGLESYSLGKLAMHFNIENKARHRAMGDAMATTKLLEILIKKDNWNLFNKSIRTNDALTNMHPHLNKSSIDQLPQTPGVYTFLDEDEIIIYIGKSVNIHQRIISHLNNDKSAKSLEMKNKIADIKFHLTGSDLIAQLLESDMIKSHKPFYNRVLKRDGFKFGIYTHYDTRGYLNFTIKKALNHSEAILTFNGSKQARNFISRMEANFGICYMEKNTRNTDQCLRYLNGDCLGACIAAPEVNEYNAIFMEMLNELLFDSGEYFIQLDGRDESEIGFVFIKEKKFQGYGFAPKNVKLEKEKMIKSYLINSSQNYDNHLIVKSYLHQNEIVKIEL